jgi:hypothetical protein
MFPDGPQQELVVNVVEQTSDIELQYPVVLPAPLSRNPYSVQRRFVRPVPIGVCQKDGF